MSKKHFFKDSIILITGGTGSWGNELTKQLLETQHSLKEVRQDQILYRRRQGR